MFVSDDFFGHKGPFWKHFSDSLVAIQWVAPLFPIESGLFDASKERPRKARPPQPTLYIVC